MTDLEKAVELLSNGFATCAVCKDDNVYSSDKRGVAPLLNWLDEGVDFSGAYLYVLLKVKNIYALIISKPALSTLENYGISVTYDKLVEAIANRTKDGFCPMEQAVFGASTPEEALSLIREKLKLLAAGDNN